MNNIPRVSLALKSGRNNRNKISNKECDSMNKLGKIVTLILFLIINITATTTANAGFAFIEGGNNVGDFAVKTGETETISLQFNAPDANSQSESDLIGAGYVTYCYKASKQKIQAECESTGFNSVILATHSEYNSPTHGNAYASCKIEYRCLKLFHVKH